MEQKNENEKFLKGLFCGVFLVLICMAGCLLHLQWKMTRRAAVSTGSEKTETLDMNLSQVKKKTGEIEELINAYYLDEIDGQKVEDTMYTGMVAGLEDLYSVYYSKEELESMEESISGAYSGIGATLTQDPDTGELSVVSCFDGTPAQEAGLQPGDVITGWNGKSVEGIELSELVSKIKTDPEEQLTLEIERDGETLEVELTRREVQIPTVEYEMLDNQIGYIRLVEFDEVTADQFKEALEDLENQNMEKLIIDVRNNPGGVLQVVCDMLDQLLPEGLIVYTEDKNGNRKEYTSDEEHQFTKPLAVLANENSASAAEIFAGAIKDYDYGTLIGTKSFGKGIVQTVKQLKDGSAIKLTTAKYYTPNGNYIHEVGIEPDVELEYEYTGDTNEDYDKSQDNQIQKALEILESDVQNK